LIEAIADDPAPGSGVREVRFFYRYCPMATGCQGQIPIGVDNTGPSPYSATWIFPSCGTAPEDRFAVEAFGVDNCGNTGPVYRVDDLRLVSRGCLRAGTSSSDQAAASWQSDLRASGGRGQVVVDGAQAVYPDAGTESFTTPLGPGEHRFEATLVAVTAGRGASTWRFDLAPLGVAAGSLRVVAGDVAQVAADTVVFRLRGQAGERVVFTFDVAAR